ncbi:PREDICTED: low affinity immunoglobulin gamma Fc region receptor III-A [Condylura cristata]|uniref:low affinity immunoglobulin gamma Fc region receptor III-A n=1 Tax=Condylura cristata TaxID=143302 RepID=UPI000643B1FA|nr:PREDICTED: low affinity immunoglobulin gamma Fc region receptor III-A [Condylura cristata]
MHADPPKAMVFLDSIYDRVLKDDCVNLRCQGPGSPDSSPTKWLHNGSTKSITSSNYSFTVTGVDDSGEYKCQNGLFSLSEPMRLQVYTDWLVLQSRKWTFQEGETIQLKCHSWRNRSMTKVSYLQNGKVLKYSHYNSDLTIPNARREHTGSYYCRGLYRNQRNVSSASAKITVTATVVSPILSWLQITFYLVMGLLFVVDMGLYFFARRDLRSLVKNRRNFTFKWTHDSYDP